MNLLINKAQERRYSSGKLVEFYKINSKSVTESGLEHKLGWKLQEMSYYCWSPHQVEGKREVAQSSRESE